MLVHADRLGRKVGRQRQTAVRVGDRAVVDHRVGILGDNCGHHGRALRLRGGTARAAPCDRWRAAWTTCATSWPGAAAPAPLMVSLSNHRSVRPCSGPHAEPVEASRSPRLMLPRNQPSTDRASSRYTSTDYARSRPPHPTPWVDTVWAARGTPTDLVVQTASARAASMARQKPRRDHLLNRLGIVVAEPHSGGTSRQRPPVRSCAGCRKHARVVHPPWLGLVRGHDPTHHGPVLVRKLERISHLLLHRPLWIPLQVVNAIARLDSNHRPRSTTRRSGPIRSSRGTRPPEPSALPS